MISDARIPALSTFCLDGPLTGEGTVESGPPAVGTLLPCADERRKSCTAVKSQFELDPVDSLASIGSSYAGVDHDREIELNKSSRGEEQVLKW